jgi:hypothetical protein
MVVTLELDAFKKAQFTMITLFASEHKQQLHEENSDHGRAWLAKMHMQYFNVWLRDYVQTCNDVVKTYNLIKNISRGAII